jgi:hypothetical protein
MADVRRTAWGLHLGIEFFYTLVFGQIDLYRRHGRTRFLDLLRSRGYSGIFRRDHKVLAAPRQVPSPVRSRCRSMRQ